MSQSTTSYESHIQSLLKFPRIRPEVWKIETKGQYIGDYELTLKLGKEFPTKAPEVIMQKGLTHPLVNEETGQVMISELTYEWSPNSKLVSTLRDLIDELNRNTTALPNQKDKEEAVKKKNEEDQQNQNEMIAQLEEWAKVSEDARKKVEEKLTAEQELVKNMKKELEQLKNMKKELEQLKEEKLAEKNETKKEIEHLKKDLKQMKEQNLQLGEMIKIKDELAGNLRLKNNQLTIQQQGQEASKIESRVPSEQSQLEDFNRQLKQQIEDLKKQLVNKKKLEDENTEEVKELNEMNGKLDKQNRSFSDRIKTLEEKIDELKELEEQRNKEHHKEILERDECIELLKQQNNQASVAIVEEKNQQIQQMTTLLQKTKEESDKEKEALEEQIQELRQLLERAAKNNSHLKLKSTQNSNQEFGSEDQMTTKKMEDEYEVVDANTLSPRVLKEGTMEKLGNHIFSSTQSRKYTLQSDGLLVYENVGGKKGAKSQIDLTKAKFVKKIGNFEISVEMPDQKWQFRCSTTNDRDDWIQVMTSIGGVKCECCGEEN